MHAHSLIKSVAILACLSAPSAWGDATPAYPPASHNLVVSAPVPLWDDAIPLGNGRMGGLLWGEKNILRVSLDRGDLWDERTHGGKEWWKTKNWAWGRERIAAKDFGAVGSAWDSPYNGVTPTKLPAGRLEITLPAGREIDSFELSLATAEGRAHLRDGQTVEVFYSAVRPVALMRIPGPEPEALALIPAGAKSREGTGGPSSGGAVAKLGYPPARHGEEGRARWFVQEGVDGMKYCACLETLRVDGETLVAFTVTATMEDPDPLALARRLCAEALDRGYAALRAPHAEWWRRFWAQSSVQIPEAEIQNYHSLCRYFYGAASRKGAPPMPLQGVWTADNGGLPPWKGDYHNDLNTQMTYIAYHAAGNFDEGACYLDFLCNLTPAFTAFARDFYGTPGLSSPGVMSLAGQPLGGWGQYSLSPTMTSWNAHLFYLHWRYTMDESFLREKAYPWCKAAGECVSALLKPDEKGILKLPLSSSPEIFGNSPRAWLLPNSNYDLMCMKAQFLALTEMADALGRADEAKRWRATADAFGDFHADASGALLLDAKTPLGESHRHLSNLMALFPFNLITCEGGEGDRQRIRASLALWDRLGTSEWCGYSFAWMSALKARTGDPEGALRLLDIFVKAFVTRNGFHVNGDQTKSGYSRFTYRPFTLEGNFAALQAVHEMLLQSWSPTPGQRDTEVLRIFPATPWRWHDAAFTDLRAEGGHRVSARRRNNATEWFRVVAGRDGMIRLRDNFGGRAIQWSGRAVPVKRGDNFEVMLRRGDALEATLAVPAEIPAPPADLAKPVAARSRSGISPSELPLRIGADSNGNNRFRGDIARVVVLDKALDDGEIAALANPEAMVGVKDFEPVTAPQLLPAVTDRAFRIEGQGYLEVPHAASPDGWGGLTLAAWIRPSGFPESGMRIIDKSPAGTARGYLLDTYPGDSLRLITAEPHLVFPAKLPAGRWTHVAATVDGKTGRKTLYMQGRPVVRE